MNVKKQIENTIKKTILCDNVVSITIVGSFVDKDDLTGISDIDTIVICKSLTESWFQACVDKLKKITPASLGEEFAEYKLKINSTFGPLKFDEPKLIVIHLMVYDIQAHYKHVIESPFTCLDWERSSAIHGKALQEIFPVGKLQPRDFGDARRGLDNYLEDIGNGSISFREYSFEDEQISEIKKQHPLDDRHRGEYAFHIVRNLLLNHLKLLHNDNRLFSTTELENSIGDLFGNQSTEYREKFRIIAGLKQRRSHEFPEWTLQWAKDFISVFQNALREQWASAKSVYFMRHAQTELNDGSFLGQGRDPSILSSRSNVRLEVPVENVYSSPARRCLETAQLVSNLPIQIDERLLEMNYGSAEGLTFGQLKDTHSEIIQAWNSGEDPRFPEGENTAEVLSRLKNFNEQLAQEAKTNTLVITHNVVLRCLIGNAHAIPTKYWHRLIIPHNEPLEFKLLNKQFYTNIPRPLLGDIFKGFLESENYMISMCPS